MPRHRRADPSMSRFRRNFDSPRLIELEVRTLRIPNLRVPVPQVHNLDRGSLKCPRIEIQIKAHQPPLHVGPDVRIKHACILEQRQQVRHIHVPGPPTTERRNKPEHLESLPLPVITPVRNIQPDRPLLVPVVIPNLRLTKRQRRDHAPDILWDL